MSLSAPITIPVNLTASNCACCGDVCSGPTSGVNVFEITKEEYDSYKAGGTWNLGCSMYHSESGTINDVGCSATATSGGTITVTGSGSGCGHSVSGTYATSISLTVGENTNTGTDNRPVSLNAELGYDSSTGKYYIAFTASVGDVTSGSGTNTGYPPTIGITVAGNVLTVYSSWTPGWSTEAPDYSCSGHETLDATFTPN